MKIDPEYEHKYEEIVKSLVLKTLKDETCQVFLFGSRATGDYRFGSDFDIGINQIDREKFISFKYQIIDELEESIVPWKIDIVNFDAVSEQFRNTAMRNTIEWKNN